MTDDKQPHQCPHRHIQSFSFEDGAPAQLWACSECMRKFGPVPALDPLTDARVWEIVDATPPLRDASCEWLIFARAIERAHGIGAELKP